MYERDFGISKCEETKTKEKYQDNYLISREVFSPNQGFEDWKPLLVNGEIKITENEILESHLVVISRKPFTKNKKYSFSIKIDSFVSNPFMIFGVSDEKFGIINGNLGGTGYFINSSLLYCSPIPNRTNETEFETKSISMNRQSFLCEEIVVEITVFLFFFKFSF